MLTLINHPGLKVVKGLQLQTPSPSIGLAYLGAYLKSKGFEYKGIDGCGEALDHIYPYRDSRDILVQGLTFDQILERIPKDATIFAFTCLFSQCWPMVHRMASEMRKLFPTAHFIAGGEHPTALPEPILNAGVFDTIVYGEGEETFCELISLIRDEKDWRSIDGIIYGDKQRGIIKNCPRKRIASIDQFPYPDWDAWFVREYIDHHQVTGIDMGRSIPILGSRGCPYACTFCSNEDMWTRRYIMRDAKGLVDEMDFMKKKYEVTGFNFMDSTFVVNRRKTLEFANELITRKLNITYQLPAGTRCEAFNEELVLALEKSGLRNFALAPESGSEFILKAIKKQVDLNKMLCAVHDILKTRMTVAVFMVIGFPEDTKETLKPTLRLIRKLAWLGVHDVTVSKFTPYPGSPYYNRFIKEGRVMADYQDVEKLVNFFDIENDSFCEGLSSKQLHRYMIWFFVNFYVLSFLLRPWRVLRNLFDYFFHGTENTRYMRLFSELFFLRRKWILNKKTIIEEPEADQLEDSYKRAA